MVQVLNQSKSVDVSLLLICEMLLTILIMLLHRDPPRLRYCHCNGKPRFLVSPQSPSKDVVRGHLQFYTTRLFMKKDQLFLLSDVVMWITIKSSSGKPSGYQLITSALDECTNHSSASSILPMIFRHISVPKKSGMSHEGWTRSRSHSKNQLVTWPKSRCSQTVNLYGT